MQKSKVILSFLLICSLFTAALAQHGETEEPPSLVKWLTFKEAFELNKTHPKPFIIDVYTDWCGWCKHMMKTTYSSPDIANYINTWFYPVKFNAETKDTIEYQGTKYVNEGTGPKSTHQLALKLLGNQLMYPTTIFASYAANFILNSQGFLDTKKIEPILVYTLENIFRTTSYDDFSKNFEKAFYDTIKPKVELKWYTFNKALELNKKQPRKILVAIYTSWCNGCRVMNKTTFSDSMNVSYINKNFYLVDFNAESKDTISFAGTKYYNNGANGTPFHQLAMNLVKNNLALPSTVVIDEKLLPVDIIPQYLSPLTLDPVLRFYGSNAYKTEKWPDFQKKYSEKKLPAGTSPKK
jgi:thioredoxin-related protein